MKCIKELPSTTFSGRRFTRRHLEQVQEVVGMFANLSRKELAQTVCEHLEWKNARGANKTDSCLKMLETLEAHGLVKLPEKRDTKNIGPKHAVKNLDLAEQGAPLSATLDDISPIVLERVVSADQRAAFKASIQAHHYLGYKHPVGSQIAYFIVSQRDGRRLGCLRYCSSASWDLPARDQWIGWEKRQREKLLHFILNQDRFLIFPWVNVPHLASHVLSLAEKQVSSDWVETYGYRPVLMETFVDPTHGFSGTCYRAANWHWIGQTQGRGDRDPHPCAPSTDKGQKTVKDIFVRPLVKDLKHALTEGYQTRAVKRRYRNDVKCRTGQVDDAFLALWKRVLHLLHEVAEAYDKRWRVRERVIDTLLLMLLIFRLVTAKNKQSYGTTIDELWDNCRELDVPLVQKESIAPSSLCAARKKLDENVFKCLQQRILETYAEHNADRFLWHGHRVFAVDGSKINLPRPLRHLGYPLPSQSAQYPQGLVSCLYALKSQLPVDFDLVSNGDERGCAQHHLRVLHAGDVVVYDRGYFSYVLLHHHFQAGVHAVFRLQESTASAITKFRNGPQTDTTVTIFPSPRTLSDIAQAYPDIHLVPRTIRLVKYQFGTTTFCLGTTLVEPKDATIPVQALADLYFSRWGVEELYKVSKRLLLIEDFHAKHERGVKQELFAHFVLITINRLFTNHADTDLNQPTPSDEILQPQALPHHAPKSAVRCIKANFKNCIHVVARLLEPLLLFHTKLVRAVKTAYDLIIKHHQRVRPGRSYPRKSMRPESKWQPSKKYNRKKQLAVIPTAP